MNKILITSMLLIAAIALHAQNVPAGKTYKAALQNKGTITMTVGGNDMDIPMAVEENVDVKIATSDNGNVTGVATVTSFKITTTPPMQQEQTFSSDDPSLSSNPEFAKLLKPQDFQLKNGKIAENQNVNAGLQATGLDVASKLVLPVSGDNLKLNYTWKASVSDSTGSTSDENDTITKLTADEVEVSFVNTVKAIATRQQNGMEIKQNFAGTGQGKRTYDKATGVLKTETGNIDLKGKTEAMGQEMPTSIKGTITMTVN
jgi:hypothetical protein